MRAEAATQFRTHRDTACVVCGAPVPEAAIGSVKDHEYATTTPMEFPVVQCPRCQLVYLYPRPDVSELGTIYPPDYYSYHLAANAPDQETGRKSRVQQIFHKLNVGRFRARIMPYLNAENLGRPLRVLDVGCGTGHQLDIMREIFPGCETHGVEMGSVAAEKARQRGHQVVASRFEEADLPQGQFDVVISLHVIEHVARPDEFLAKCRDLLTDEGVALIETPNTDSWDFRLLRKGHWGGYHAPRHWYLFQRQTFEILAQRLSLSIEAANPYPISVFWNWTCHSLALHFLPRSIADALFPPVKIFYGGLRSLVLLGGFSVFESLTMRMSGKACGLWIVFSKPSR